MYIEGMDLLKLIIAKILHHTPLKMLVGKVDRSILSLKLDSNVGTNFQLKVNYSLKMLLLVSLKYSINLDILLVSMRVTIPIT